MKKCVVSFANTPMYQAKMKRLEASLKGRTDADFLGLTSYAEVGCKPHSEVPYQFKPYSIQKAIDLGYELILWCDSPVHAVKDLSLVFNYIEEHGYMFFDNIGHQLGKWSNQKSLDYFFFSREEAMEMKMIMACCMGFDVRDKFVKAIIDEYTNTSDDLYPGSWADHRHDQTVMSFLIDQYGLEILNGQQTFFMYENHRFAVPINEATICLISE